MPGVKGQVQARGVERRRAIVEAAIAHFAREGYRGTGIAGIAEAAGVTTGGLLHHFGSKEGLLVEVLKERDRAVTKDLRNLGMGTVEEDFARWVDAMTWNEERTELAALYSILLAEALDPDHPAHAYMDERNKAVRGILRDTLQRGIDSGEIRPDVDVARKADEIHSFLEGAQMLWLYEKKRKALTKLVRGYMDDQLSLMRAR